MIYKTTTATNKIFELKKRIRAVAGGTSASKTISILIWLIDYCQVQQDRRKLATVVSESYPHLEKGSMYDFQTIMMDRGYWDQSRWNKTKHSYEFETGNTLEFFSVDTYGKAHGPRRDVLFLNECNNLPFNIVDQLITRTREIIWMDWNPSSEFWFYTELLGKRQDIDFITLTYKDNEALDATSIAEIESHRDNKNWWLVYGEGKLGVVEGRIYTDWQLIDSIPHEARLERYGLDFGYSNDPAAIVAVYRYNGGFIWEEKLFQKGMSNKQIADVLNNLPKALVMADSAEPKSIDELRMYGINILPSHKGPGSITHGIQYVQAQRISVPKSSTNLIKEYRNYLWQTDKDGEFGKVPGVLWNHCLDAGRYAMESLRTDTVEELPPDDTQLFRGDFY